MNAIRACVLGCKAVDDIQFRAAPGRLVCDRCAERLAGVLADIALIYAILTDVESLIPGGGDGSHRAVPGPRSPAADAILVHTDPRSTWDGHPAALATIESWARMVREETGAAVPLGRITMVRELETIRFNWDWILGQPWVDELASEMRDVLAALRIVGRTGERVLRIGTCPGPPPLDDEEIPPGCGAALRVRVGDEAISCHTCGSSWPRSRWGELGDPWTDYARLAAELGVPGGTLRYWCSQDHWSVGGSHGRRLVLRADAVTSYVRRRGPLSLDQEAG